MGLGNKVAPPKGGRVQEDLGLPQQRNGVPSTTDLDRARDYLDTTSPDLCREDWVRVLMALKNTFGDSGEILARGWSAGSDKFNPRDFRDTWQSLSYDGSVSLGTIAHYSGHTPSPSVTKPKRDTQKQGRDWWEQGRVNAVATHPYALKKRITHDFGARRVTASGSVIGQDADCIIVPMRQGDDLVGIELINPEGQKQTFGRKGVLILGYPEGATEIHVCEGWATAFALSQMFPKSFACAVTFGCGKTMKDAAQALASKYLLPVVLHEEAEDNQDAWDYWDAGRADEYRALVNVHA